MAAWVSAPAVALAQSHEAAGVGDGLSVVVSLGIGASVQGSCPRAAPCPVKPFGDASASHRSGGAQGVPAVAQSPIGSPSGVGVALRPPPKPFPKLGRFGMGRCPASQQGRAASLGGGVDAESHPPAVLDRCRV